MSSKLIIGITQGDTNGVGYEVIIKAFSDTKMLELCTPVIYGSSKAFGIYKKGIPETDNINTNIINSPENAHPKRVNIINCVSESSQIEPGKPTKDGSEAAIDALNAAVKDLKEGKLDALVTAPINKKGISDKVADFVGHTEFLTEYFNADQTLMFLCSDKLRIGVATGHIPLAEVSKQLSTDLILSKLRIMNSSLLRDFNITKPKIAVLGLNPHSGDNGILGNEEIDIIKPAIDQANEEKILTFGPYPPDGFFSVGMQYKFDAVLAMYHDQGLIPFKSLAFNEGVNFTAGLPIVRTSPDHGTAYDIVGENKADAQSMLSAIYMAIDVVKSRNLYDEITKNPLEIAVFETNQKERPFHKPIIE